MKRATTNKLQLYQLELFFISSSFNTPLSAREIYPGIRLKPPLTRVTALVHDSVVGEIIYQRDSETLPNASLAGIFMALKARATVVKLRFLPFSIRET